MTNRNYLNAAYVLLAALLIAACESSGPTQKTSVDRVLMSRNISNAPYSKVLVIGAVPSRETARNIEYGLSKELEAARVEAHSFVRESASKEPSDEAVQALIVETGVDGVIIVSGRLVGAASVERDEQVDFDAETRGGRLFNYFRYDYKDIVRPSYADFTRDVVLVSDFYDAESGDRIYSVESSTAHGKTSFEIITAESKAIIKRLKQDGLIR